MKNQAEVSRIRKYIAKVGIDFHKYELIKDFVWKKFQLARSKYLPVKDENLKRWSLPKSKEIKLENFTASQSWIRRFKISRNMSSRKITKVISSKSAIDNEKITEQGRAFVKHASKKLVNFDRSIIVNSNQSGFNYELYSNRTLNFLAEKGMIFSVNSLNAISHSCTIYTINLKFKRQFHRQMFVGITGA